MFEKGNDYLVFIKRKNDTNWRTVACIISNELGVSSEVVDISSGCGGNVSDHFNGKTTFTIDANGLAISDNLQPSQVSHEILFALASSGEPFAIKIAKVGSLYVREGVVTIVDYRENQTVNEFFGFSVTFRAKGRINGGFLKFLADTNGSFIVTSDDKKIVVDVRNGN